MTTDHSDRLSLKSLILVPALITLAITILRLVGELQNWSPTFFSRAAGGAGAIVGIVWLVPIFGAYFAVKLAKAGPTPGAGRVIGYSALAIGFAVLAITATVKTTTNQSVHFGVFMVVTVIAGVIAYRGWPALGRVLLAYGLAARLPVVIVMLIAIYANWGTHYDVAPPNMAGMAPLTKWFMIGLLPQMLGWIPFTICVGALFGGLALLAVGGRREVPVAGKPGLACSAPRRARRPEAAEGGSGVSLLDWAIVVLYFVASAAVGVYYARRAGSNLEEFFLSGRDLPWWLAGTSMVATTFAADTPLAVTELVAKNGIAGNWLWWNFAFGSVLTVFFFARLWRRAGIMTDVEFVELRYSGRPAAFLRGFRALYLGIFMNCVIMAWVNLAMGSILEGMFGIPPRQVLLYVALSLVVTAGYSALSGLWGVAVTDAFQFALAMIGTIVLAVVVVQLPAVGGLAGLKASLPAWTLRFTPALGGTSAGQAAGAFALSVSAFLAYVGVQWWASWYPGAEPGGGGYVAQRIMSAKDEKHSLYATLWFTIAHYCIRPWPWILVGLASLVLYPQLGPDQKRLGYVWAMRDYLPNGLKGMLVAAFFAAYMSTISTQLNWGTSYVINDFYKRFVKPQAGERDLVRLSRMVTIVVMALSLLTTTILATISGAWAFIIEAGAGLGLVLILRWFWWRINAWSEIAAMVTPLLAYGYLRAATSVQFPETLYYIVAVTTVVWLAVTFATRPVDEETLKRFFRRVHPGGPGWARVATLVPEVRPDSGYAGLFVDWIAGVALIYSTLFAVGSFLFGAYGRGLLCVAVAAVSVWLIHRDLTRRGFAPVTPSTPW